MIPVKHRDADVNWKQKYRSNEAKMKQEQAKSTQLKWKIELVLSSKHQNNRYKQQWSNWKFYY